MNWSMSYSNPPASGNGCLVFLFGLPNPFDQGTLPGRLGSEFLQGLGRSILRITLIPFQSFLVSTTLIIPHSTLLPIPLPRILFRVRPLEQVGTPSVYSIHALVTSHGFHLKPALCVSTLALSFVSVSQQPFPTYADSGAWNTLLCLGVPPNACMTQTFAYDGSDTFCGSTWSIYSWPTFGLDPGIAYLRNEGQRTLLRSSTNCSDKEYVIYDFSMAVGDTVYPPLNADLFTPDTAMFVLQDIDTVDILGVERRRFSLLYDRCNTGMVNTPMEWIEGIGSTTHPFYSTDQPL